MRGVVLAVMLPMLAACGAERTADSAVQAAATVTPADQRLATLYRSSCQSCHAAPDSGAPLTHDLTAWDRRWTKGEAALLEHTISGFNGMPAGGQCFSCTADDYRALTAFMAGREE